MNATILRAKDGSGRRWLLVEGSGICTELKSAPEPPAPMPRAKRAKKKKWDGF